MKLWGVHQAYTRYDTMQNKKQLITLFLVEITDTVEKNVKSCSLFVFTQLTHL